MKATPIFLFIISLIINISCNSIPQSQTLSETELYDLYGNVASATFIQTDHETSQKINIDTFSFPTLPPEMLNCKNYTINFNTDKTIRSIISNDLKYTVTNIRINDSISHMIKKQQDKVIVRTKKTTKHMVLYQYLDPEKNVTQTLEFKIDTLNQIATLKYFLNAGKLVNEKNFHFKENWIITRMDIKNFDSNSVEDAPIIHSFHYEYDDKKSMISCAFEDIYGNINKCEYKYRYDEHNNWIEKVSMLNGEKMNTIKREITYYD